MAQPFGSLSPDEPLATPAEPAADLDVLRAMAGKLGQTWPAHLIQTALGAAALPGDVYSGATPVVGDDGRTNPEVINRSADLAGLVAVTINERLGAAVGTPRYDELMAMRSDLVKEIQQIGGPHGIGVREKGNSDYKRLAGEVEARNVQKRADWDAQRRADVPPAFSQDTPNAGQIVRFGEQSPFSMVPEPLVMKSEPKDYRGDHRPPMKDSGAPLHDLTGGGQIYPDDIYSSKAAQYYGHFGNNNPMDMQTIAQIQALKDKPHAMVTAYRAVPYSPSASEQAAKLEADMAAFMRRGKTPDDAKLSGSAWYNDAHERLAKLKATPDPVAEPLTISPGDWVTINRNYAKDHGEGTLNGQYKILSKKVRAKELFTNGDSIHEFGYDPAGGK